MANLLLVDDDVIVRNVLNLAMQRDGHQIVEAETGDACLALVKQNSPDIIFLDAKMPNMDGFTCCAHLKAALQKHCPPVIMITALEDEASVDRAFAVGATDYITKPLNTAVLRYRVRQILKEQELISQLTAINQHMAATNSDLQQLVRIDGLTQLWNRRYFEEIFFKEWRRLARQRQPLGILFCDVDFFKQYNDHYGHLAGDLCLRDLSELLNGSILRSADVVARYGGEEFVILLPDTDAAGTQCVAQRIQTKINTAAIPHAGSKVASIVTLSIGGTCVVPDFTYHPEPLLEVADRALYKAKSQGRNQVVIEPYQLENAVSING
ncbi:MAG: diguanylate cyclase [Cyanobacteria bacterium J06639_14]